MGDYSDPLQRRHNYQQQYDIILHHTEEMLIPLKLPLELIVSSLHDTWSEIRNDSAKSLVKLIDKYPDDLDTNSLLRIANKLVSTLKPQRLNKNDMTTTSSSWQVLHGSLNGLLSLSHYFKEKSKENNDIQECIIDACVKLLNHQNLLVRESSNNCIISYLIILNKSNSDNKSNKFLHHLISLTEKLIYTDLANDSESSAHELHGTLSCMISVIERIERRLIYTSDEMLSIISSCLSHKASTVRQKASQVLIISLKSSCDKDHLLLFLSDVIISCGDNNNVNSWGKLESALLICEEHIRDIFDNSNNSNIVSVYSENIAFVKLLSCLRRSLFQVLMHSEFEVRRMGSQLLPSLVRASIIFDINNIFDFCIDERMTDSTNFIEFRLIALQNTVIYAWIAEAARTIQHIIEVSDNTDNHLNWALRIKGRLLEEDAKHSFHKFLKTICNDIEDLLSKSLSFLCFLSQHLLKFICRNKNNFDVISCDSIEATLMVWAVIIPYSANEIKLNNIIRRNGIRLNFDSCQYFEKCIKSTIENILKIQKLTMSQSDVTKSPLSSPTKKFSSVGLGNTMQLISSITDPISSNSSVLCCLDAFGCNRWLCETISPILPTIVLSISDFDRYPQTILSLAKITCTWSLNTASDMSWLDRKAGARKALFESVPILAQSLVDVKNGDKDGENDRMSTDHIFSSKLKPILSIDTSSNREEFHFIVKILLQTLMLRSNLLDSHDLCRILRGFAIILTKIRSDVLRDVVLMESIKEAIQYYDKLFPSILLSQSVSHTTQECEREENCNETAEFSDWDDEESDLETSNLSVDLKSTVSINAPAPSEFASSIRDDICTILNSMSIL